MLCEHEDDDILLDDENVKVCLRCRKHEKGKMTEPGNIWFQANGSLQPLFNDGIMDIDNRRSEELEDSPLLINDCYPSANGEIHCHDIEQVEEDPKAVRKLVFAAGFCFMFMIAELIGGYIAGSLAVMTDAAHLFSDLIGFVISLLSIWLGRKPATKYLTFGFHRAEVLGALLSIFTVWMLALLFLVLGFNRLLKGDTDIDADTMLVVAGLGLTVNIVMGIILHGVGGCHSHHSHSLSSHSHQAENINVRAAAVHVIGDLLQSLGVLIAALIIKNYPNAAIADPICTIIFSLVIVGTTVRVAKDSAWFLMEASPINSHDLLFELKKLSEVQHVHSLQIWSMAPNRNAVAVHLAVDNFCDKDLVLQKAMSIIKSQIHVVSCTIQVETYNQEQINACKKCKTP